MNIKEKVEECKKETEKRIIEELVAFTEKTGYIVSDTSITPSVPRDKYCRADPEIFMYFVQLKVDL